MLPYQVMKGMRVFPPQEHKKLSQVLNGWSQAATEYGFLQYKTSVLESADIYANKTSDEIMREQTYRFTDRGGRDVLLRPEITPGVSNMIVAMQKNRNLTSPCKVFSIGSVFRYENTQKGRSREHIQFNVDLFGADSAWADAEVIAVAFSALEHIGFRKEDFIVYLNSRESLQKTILELGIPKESLRKALRLLDKRDKMSEKEFEKELSAYRITPMALDDALQETPPPIREIMEILPEGMPAEYNPKIIRGFDYYTGMVFEIYAKDTGIASRSVTGGGRYDTLIESYGGSPLPAVGFGMGDVVLLDCMEALKNNTIKEEKTVAIYVTEEQDTAKGVQAGNILRKHFPATFIGTVNGGKIAAVYKNCEQSGVYFTVGIENGSFSVRNLSERNTETYTSIDEVTQALTDTIKTS